jgi:hypothetical protein
MQKEFLEGTGKGFFLINAVDYAFLHYANLHNKKLLYMVL